MILSFKYLMEKILIWDFVQQKWISEVAETESYLFEDFHNRDSVNQFNETLSRLQSEGAQAATIVEDDTDLDQDGDEVSLYVVDGLRFVNRFGYFIYKLAEDVEDDPLKIKKSIYAWG